MSEPRPDALFAYGTLIFTEIFEAVTGARRRSSECVLADWSARLVRNRTYPGLRFAPGASTPGRLYAGLGDVLWKRLDEFEGDLYELRSVVVDSNPAGVYVVADRNLERLASEPWDPAQFRAEGYDRFLDQCRRFGAGYTADPR